ncbi:nicotinamide mononucleotide transporter [Anseongella ginsenosidimutans]|uniref:Nicotinamide riboside transporter PnuC n=1 Tax=Anseongella ginsenosidimutans TaxID=496056 RepID=A0A4R3KQ21_9SPHI|nr:nicotinamide riboside transporter PnuC [Anseongella ginsenosidimutans]QEC52307.1 nicotinamide mononucleotide transporter [Anseongella ginsenosidimutans]TCS86868.1 nicotinamide mononucleotide transporter [Anseongella ginsenosidimutans]
MDIFKILEIVGVTCGMLYLLLIIRENIWCWLFGILASAITVFLYIEFKLYLEAGLNFYYILAGIYGWIFWSRHKNKDRKTPVTDWIPRSHLLVLFAGTLLSLGLGQIMDLHTDSPRPFIDAGLTIFSFTATYMEARKVLSTWYYWFILNGVSVWLHIDRGLYFYAALSVFYTFMCIVGYLEWKKSYTSQTV